jgi:flagellar biosynthetic protein FliR
MEFAIAQFMLALLLFVRITSVVALAPIFGNMNIPVQTKVALSVFLSFIVYPMVAASAPHVNVQFTAFVVLALKEVLVGLLLGFATSLVFVGVRYAGELISYDMGFSLANVFDPESGQNNPVVGEFLYLFTLLIFLLINGHHFILQAIQFSYSSIPIGGNTLSESALSTLVALTGSVFVVAVKFAAPVVVALFLTNIALAILTRVMPQMNIFAVSMPAKVGVGIMVLMATAPLMAYVFKKLLTNFENNVLELVKAL